MSARSSARGVRAALVVTGDELLRGFVQDANSGYLAAELRQLGIELAQVRFSADGLDAIVESLTGIAAETDADLVIVSGGLGPTHDDRTSEAVAQAVGRALELRADALEQVERKVRAFGRMSTPADAEIFEPGNRKQATVPAGAVVLEPGGTAPGYLTVAAVEGRLAAGTVVVVLPGPPSELRFAWRQARASAPVRELQARVGERHERLVRVWGVPESLAARELQAAGHEDDAACSVTLCAREGELELSLRGTDVARVDALVEQLRGAFGERVFAIDDERPVAQIVGDLLSAAEYEVAVAESCTGGLVGKVLTDVAGSSAWFRGGVISYADAVKTDVLHVPHEVLDEHGAVSEATARAMAAGAQKVLGADVAIAITGVAGPGGGSAEKPVGTVHVAIAVEAEVSTLQLQLPGDRTTVRVRACAAALHGLRARLAATL